MSAARTCLTALLVAGCGTGGAQEPLPGHQPISGTGPYRRLPADSPLAPQGAPFVIDDLRESLDEPSLMVRDDGRLSAWFTVRRNGKRRIERADSDGESLGFEAPAAALVADRAWEQGEVSGASVVHVGPDPGPGPLRLFYLAGGAIGVAISDDGEAWTKAESPVLSANRMEEGMALGPPAAVVTGSAMVRLYYQAGDRGDLWAAEASIVDLDRGSPTWTRLDGNPDTPERDPVIAAANVPTSPPGPGHAELGRACALASITPVGRRRHDVFFSTAAVPGVDDSVPAIRVASSFDGLRFAVSAQPVLAPPDAHSPTVAAWRDGFLMLLSARHGMRDGIAAALSP